VDSDGVGRVDQRADALPAVVRLAVASARRFPCRTRPGAACPPDGLFEQRTTICALAVPQPITLSTGTSTLADLRPLASGCVSGLRRGRRESRSW